MSIRFDDDDHFYFWINFFSAQRRTDTGIAAPDNNQSFHNLWLSQMSGVVPPLENSFQAPGYDNFGRYAPRHHRLTVLDFPLMLGNKPRYFYWSAASHQSRMYTVNRSPNGDKGTGDRTFSKGKARYA